MVILVILVQILIDRGRLSVAVAELRAACREVGHPLADRIHANDLWIAASAVHIAAALVTADSIFEGAPGLDLAQ
jgi:predicted nucleic acid-binding protein